MYVERAAVDIEATAPTDGPGVPQVAHAMRRLTDGGPFELLSVEPISFDRYRCAFARKPRFAVGYRSVIDLQLRIDREFHIIEVTTQPVVPGAELLDDELMADLELEDPMQPETVTGQAVAS